MPHKSPWIAPGPYENVTLRRYRMYGEPCVCDNLYGPLPEKRLRIINLFLTRLVGNVYLQYGHRSD